MTNSKNSVTVAAGIFLGGLGGSLLAQAEILPVSSAVGLVGGIFLGAAVSWVVNAIWLRK